MPLGPQWNEWSTEVVVDLPNGPVGAEKPYRSDGTHDGDATVPSGFVVDVPAHGRGAGDDGLEPRCDVLGKEHLTAIVLD
jgi:hypothetical protein